MELKKLPTVRISTPWLAVCVLLLSVWAARSPASLITDPITPEVDVTGPGSVLTVLTIHETGSSTGAESGCVTWDGTVDVVGGCGSPFDGADEQAQTGTRTFSELGWNGPEDIGVVLNAAEPGGDSISLDNLSLFFFQPDGSLFFTATLPSPVAFADTDPGLGTTGFLFSLDLAQQTSVRPLFTTMFDASNRIGMAASLSDVAGGPETLFAVDLERTAIPEPSSYLLIGTGLVALAGIASRRRRANKQTQAG